MTDIEILVIAIAVAILVGVSWWALEDFKPKEPKKKRTKPHLCKVCGEKNPREFYGRAKSKCKSCVKKELRIKRSK